MAKAHEALGAPGGAQPLVVDSFAGGGSIPLEALRLGAQAFASDLNPVGVLLERFVLEAIPKYRSELAVAFGQEAERILKTARAELAEYYPPHPDGSTPHAYFWARTVISDMPDANAPPVEVPMLTTMWLADRSGMRRALRWIRDDAGKVRTETVVRTYSNGRTLTVRRPLLEVFEPKSRTEVEKPPVARGAVTCPVTGHAMAADSVREQFQGRHGGVDDARMVAVVVSRPDRGGREYRLPTETDIAAAERAHAARELLEPFSDGMSAVPDEELPYLRSIFNIQLLDVTRWGDLFTSRQGLALVTLARKTHGYAASEHEAGLSKAIRTALGLAVDRVADKCASLVVWDVKWVKASHVFGRQALGIVWDFCEVNPLSDVGWSGACEWIRKVIEQVAASVVEPGQAELASAIALPLPDDCADLLFIDPPYYDAVPYADLSDFFYVWLRRSIGDDHPDLFSGALSPKQGEIVQLAERNPIYAYKTKEYFQDLMGRAMTDGRRILRPGGLGIVVFAHTATVAWEAQLQSMVDAGWTVTGSWPIDTEMSTRLRARDSAALASSVHLVCRPRERPDGSLEETVGDWRDVLAELPTRIHDWMPRLATEGVVGADAIFACLGPALEVFSRYARVEKASGEVVRLREFLEHVWATVAREALSLVFVDADSSGLEADARVTAIWLWTVRTPTAQQDRSTDAQDGSSTKRAGYLLEYDAARKIAQGLGANLEALSSLVEVRGGIARLLPVRERAAALMEVPRPAAAARRSSQGQLALFAGDEVAAVDDTREPAVTQAATVLDRLHQAMLLFGGGRSEALHRFLSDGPGSDARLWSLAQSLSALYPSGSDEKRWVDGVLSRKKSFGY